MTARNWGKRFMESLKINNMEMKRKVEKKSFSVKIFIEEKKRIIGRVRLYVLFNELHENPFGLMEDLFVDEDQRGQGIGEGLIKAALEEARKNKCYKFIFTCSRPELYGWYQRQGFEKYGVEFRMNLQP